MRPKLISRRSLLSGFALAAGLSRSGTASAQQDLLAQLRQGGLLLFMRHANAPGIGDPENFRIDDCATQRNLSDRGRAQAVAVGERLRGAGIRWSSVQSSRWCRCLDTARLAFGSVEPWPALDSFFDDRGRADTQTAELRRALTALPGGRTEAWVTHQVNISALTGSGAVMGEVLLLRGGEVVDRIRIES